ncbi:MAG: isocitrate/isopropylmalate family dehydrogenase [Candidatus Bathyarchaeia archaeon]
MREEKTSLKVIEAAKEHFAKLVEEQLARLEVMKKGDESFDYSKQKPIIIGFCWGDGIGPIISAETQRVLGFLLESEIKEGKVEFRLIKGLTIENRVKHMKAIPDDVLEELEACHVILKGPTTTPENGDPWPNIESANVAMRRYLDLFANVRPVRVQKKGIDWIFFRENTEGAYILGSKGIMVTPELAFDFTLTTKQGAERIIRLAFDYAAKNNINRVTVVTKANVVKTSDGLFLETAREVSKDYPAIQWDEWYIDIMTAKLIDPKRRTQFRVIVLPNLYGDILTDEAAEMQGGVGTVGSANIGKRYAMFEAIHGSAPRMIEEGRGKYADPSSLIRASAMLLRHIGLRDKAQRLDVALDICTQYEAKMKITGRDTGATASEFTEYLISTLKDPNLEVKWRSFAT